MNCFISYNTEEGKPLSDKVRDILLRNGVNPIDFFDTSIGDSFANEISDKIKRCDMFVGIITNLSPNVYYEIGIAKGLKKPIFVLLDKWLNIYPSFLNDFLYVRANTNDDENIDFAFKQFIKKQSKKKLKVAKNTNQYFNNTPLTLPNLWKSSLSEIRKNGTALDLENYMLNIINSLNTTSMVVEQDKGVDFALWLDDIDPNLGNPVLVEVKFGNITTETLNKGERQLQNHLIKTKSKAGLLLYLDGGGRKFPLGSSLSPLVIKIDY